jgi:HK97 family phage prohead protease
MRPEVVRSYALDDIRIRAGGDGRTVEAYMAVFDTPAEIRDQDGHYIETYSRTSFNKTIADNQGRGFPVVYHHGYTLAGTPSEVGSVPVGRSIEIRPDDKGVLTVARYNATDLADRVLESIRNGDIAGQSFSGMVIRSDPAVPRGGFRPNRDGTLRTVTRQEVRLLEFGPTPYPAFKEASILNVRTQKIVDMLSELDEDELSAYLRSLRNEPTTVDSTTETVAADPTEEPHELHSARSLALRIKAARAIRGME